MNGFGEAVNRCLLDWLVPRYKLKSIINVWNYFEGTWGRSCFLAFYNISWEELPPHGRSYRKLSFLLFSTEGSAWVNHCIEAVLKKRYCGVSSTLYTLCILANLSCLGEIVVRFLWCYLWLRSLLKFTSSHETSLKWCYGWVAFSLWAILAVRNLKILKNRGVAATTGTLCYQSARSEATTSSETALKVYYGGFL